MKIAITGINGYIGQNMSLRAINQGFEILALCRTQPIYPKNVVEWYPFDLSRPKLVDLPHNLLAVIHLATQVNNFSSDSIDLEIRSTKLLIESTSKVGARFIFISSQTAALDAPSLYGQMKWKIERLVLEAGGIVIRPGQVYGGHPGGLYYKLLHLAKSHLVLPKFFPAPLIQPLHINDLLDAIDKLLLMEGCNAAIYSLGTSKPIPFTNFLKSLSAACTSNCHIWIPIPTIIPVVLSKIFSTNQQLQQLKSLLMLNPMVVDSSIRELGIDIHEFPYGLNDNKFKSQKLIQEGATLYRYLLGANPPFSFLKNYKNAILSLENVEFIKLHNIYSLFPCLLKLVFTNQRGEKYQQNLAFRIHIASVLAEASQSGAAYYIGIGQKTSFIKSTCGVLNAIFQEMLWRILGVIFRPILKILKLYPGQ